MNLYHRLFSKYAVSLRDGRAKVVGKITKRHLLELEEVCRDLGIKRCELWSNGIDRVSFSKDVPQQAQQRLRNALFALFR